MSDTENHSPQASTTQVNGKSYYEDQKPKPAPLDASKLIFKSNPNPTEHPPLEEIKFGNQFSDYMMNIQWDSEAGWHSPVIEPLGNISIHPSCSGLHYGVQIFEGMKAYKGKNGKCFLFRPDKNFQRLNKSASRLGLPNFDEGEFLKLVKKLVSADKHHIPYSETPGFSLYLRPYMYSTHKYLGVSSPQSATLSVISCSAATYFANTGKPLKILATTEYARSYPGSAGDAKVGGNYAPTIQPMADASKLGFSQILWLHHIDDDYVVTEAGTMNIFFYWINEEGKKELITPKLENNLILPGVTRASILELAKDYPELDSVKESTIWMKKDLVKAFNEGRVLEIFGAGTAAIVSTINTIEFETIPYSAPYYVDHGPMGIGPLAAKIKDHIFSIQYGEIQHPWAVEIE